MKASMKIAYADPPYPGCANLYPEKTEVDHRKLIQQLEEDYDGFILHTSSPALGDILAMCRDICTPPVRVMAWVKPFAAFKRNVPVAYAWEPVIVQRVRKQVVAGRCVMRDWISESITLKKGLCGAKPVRVIRWAFEMVGAEPEDTLDDLYPGTGIVGRTWKEWQEAVALGFPRS
jgi:hypothetical protein